MQLVNGNNCRVLAPTVIACMHWWFVQKNNHKAQPPPVCNCPMWRGPYRCRSDQLQPTYLKRTHFFWYMNWSCSKLCQCRICRVGQNHIYTTYMIVYMVISLPRMPCTHCIYIWFWPTLRICKKHTSLDTQNGPVKSFNDVHLQSAHFTWWINWSC
jgi:hypothetical protein